MLRDLTHVAQYTVAPASPIRKNPTAPVHAITSGDDAKRRDKGCDPKDGDGSHEHRPALFADKTVFKGKSQQAQGAGTLNRELRREGAMPSRLS